MKKLIIILLIVIFISAFAFSRTFYSPERLFKLHVLSEISETINNLKYYQDKCGMHGPIIFVFEASLQDINKIITNNNLIKYERIPEFASALLSHIDKHALACWKPLQELKQMKIYGKEDKSSYEPHLIFIFVDKEEHVYYLHI